MVGGDEKLKQKNAWISEPNSYGSKFLEPGQEYVGVGVGTPSQGGRCWEAGQEQEGFKKASSQKGQGLRPEQQAVKMKMLGMFTPLPLCQN